MSKKHKPKQCAARKAASEYITISVAEYVFLVKAATLLEVIANDPSYDGKALEAVKATVAAALYPETVVAEK